MAPKGPGDLPVPDLRTMKELCQPSLNGWGGPIAPIAIQATNFGLNNDMIQQSINVNGVTDDALHLYLFPHSLTHHSTAWFDRGTFMKTRPEECYDLIENMTAHHNDWDTSAQWTTVGNTQNVYAVGAYQGNSYQPQGNRNLLSYRSENYLGPPERETDATKDTVQPTNNGSTKGIQPPVVQSESLVLNYKPVNSSIIEPVASPLFLPCLSPTYITLELADCLNSHPIGVTEDVFVKVGTFHFLADFIVVDFDADPRAPLILEISFFKIKRAFIDVLEGELTLRVGKEAITFNLDQTSRYSTNYNDMTANQMNVIDMAL
nr:reverse transcriptase domain-containing protein [Tanacetum cinerariifolium]